MAKPITFTIVAVNKATAQIHAINQSMSKLTRPYKKLATSVKQFSNVSGLTKVGQKLREVATSGARLAGSLAKIGTPLLALVGGGTIAGITELAIAWARVGAETERTATLLGISSAKLTEMRGGAQLTGVSADELTSGFRSLSHTLQDARWGRNQGAMAALMSMGISLHTTKTGAVDTERAMGDLADRIKVLQSRDPAAARNLARMFGVEGLLPMLIKGGAGMKAYQEEASRLRGAFTPEMAARATDFALAMNKSSLAVDGLKASVADKLMPVIQPLLEGFTQWIVANRELIATKVAEYAQLIADWISKIDWKEVWQDTKTAAAGLLTFCRGVSDTVEALGGMKTVLIAIGVYMAGGFVSSAASATMAVAKLVAKMAMLGGGGGLGLLGKAGILGATGVASYEIASWLGAGKLGDMAGRGTYDSTHQAGKMETGTSSRAIRSLMAMGWSQAQAAGIAANLKTESGFNTDSVGDNGKAYGIAQWHGDRQAAFKARFGKDIHDAGFDEQLQFLNYELTQGSEQSAGRALRGATSASQAGALVSRYYERPLDADGEASRRGALADKLNAAPVVQVQNHVTVNKDGSVSVKTQTPSGLKIETAMPS